VELGYQEAIQICKDLLHMPVPQLPFTLVQLLGVGSKMKVTNPNTSADGGDDDDSSGAEIDEEEDVDDDNDDELIIEQDKNMDAD
jgi:hypothetical protein